MIPDAAVVRLAPEERAVLEARLPPGQKTLHSLCAPRSILTSIDPQVSGGCHTLGGSSYDGGVLASWYGPAAFSQTSSVRSPKVSAVSDKYEVYKAAKQHLEMIERRMAENAEIIKTLAMTLNQKGWDGLSLTNDEFYDRAELLVGGRKLESWPSLSELRDILAARHQAQYSERAAWNALPPELRKGLAPHSPTTLPATNRVQTLRPKSAT